MSVLRKYWNILMGRGLPQRPPLELTTFEVSKQRNRGVHRGPAGPLGSPPTSGTAVIYPDPDPVIDTVIIGSILSQTYSAPDPEPFSGGGGGDFGGGGYTSTDSWGSDSSYSGSSD